MRPSSPERIPEFRPTLNRIISSLPTKPGADRNNALSEFDAYGRDLLWDAALGNYGDAYRQPARMGAVYLAYSAYASGNYSLKPVDAETFEDYFGRYVADAFINRDDWYLSPDLLDDLWRRMNGERPTAKRWKWVIDSGDDPWNRVLEELYRDKPASLAA